MTRLTAARRWKTPVFVLIIALLLACLVWTTLIDGNTLQMAVMRGDTARVRLFLFAKPSLARFRTFHNYTPLHWAAMDGKTEIARMLISKGANVNAVSQEGVSPLFLAAQRGQTEVVRLLLKHSAGVGTRAYYNGPQYGGHYYWYGSCDDDTALHAAADNNHAEVIELLLAAGADVNVRGSLGYTPLHMAVRSNCPDAVRVLLNHHADYRAKGKGGDAPLMYIEQACVLREFVRHGIKPTGGVLLCGAYDANLPLVREALNAGIDPSFKDEDGDTALHGAAFCDVPLMPDAPSTNDEPERVQITELLIAHGADVNARNKAGITPLQAAAYSGGRQVAKALLKHGAKAEGIHVAVALGRMSDVREMLRNNPTLIDSQTPKGLWEGMRPLDVAVVNVDMQMSAVLLDLGANPNTKDKYGNTPLKRAFTKGRMKVLKFLIDRTHPNPTLLLSDAAGYCNIEAAKYLLKLGANPNYAPKGYNEAIASAVGNGHAKMLDFLLSNGAVLGQAERAQMIQRAPEFSQNSVAMAEACFAHGGRANTVTLNGETLIEWVMHTSNDPDAIACLIRHGANVDALSREGESPLDLAHDPETIRILLEHGAKPGPGLQQGPTFWERIRAFFSRVLHP